jgi:steroid delta-isomerase-like uncharacterized protein
MSPTATRTDTEAIAGRYAEAWNSQDLESILAAHSEDGIFHLHAGGEPAEGRDAIRAAFAGVLAQLPDVNFEQKHLTVTDEGWILESTMSGTPAEGSEFDGEQVGAPGARIAIDCLDVIRLDADGLIAEKHTYLDTVTMLRQAAGDK